MEIKAYIVFAILAVAVVLFAFEWVPPEVVAVLTLVSLSVFGILTPQEAFAGFSSNAVIAIAALLVISAGLVRSGAVKWLAGKMEMLAGSRYSRILLVSTAAPGIISGFINIVASVSIFIPAILRLARRNRMGSAELMLPMAVCSLAGANLSLIGASHNLVVNSVLQQQTGSSFGFFEFAPIGAILLIGTIIYSLLFSRVLFNGKQDISRQTAEETPHNLIQTYKLNKRLWEILVQPDSPVCDHTMEDIGPGSHYGLSVLLVMRQQKQLAVENKKFVIEANDVLALSGSQDRVEAFIRDHSGLVLMGQPIAEEEFTWSAFDMVEVVVPPRSKLIGKTLRQSDLRRKTGMTAVGLWRNDKPIRSEIRDRVLAPGDGILLIGGRDKVRDFVPRPDFLWLQKPRKQEAPLHLRKFAPVAALIFLAVIASAALNWLSIAVAALAGAAAMVLLGIIDMKGAYNQIDWRTLILIGGMYPIGTALQKTGAAEFMAELIQFSVGPFGTAAALVTVAFMTLLLTQPMHNAVAALIMTPVAIKVAGALDANPKAFALAVLVAASASFLMPVGHPAPLLVRKPGGYRNIDYLKFGFGPALFILAVVAVVVPLFW